MRRIMADAPLAESVPYHIFETRYLADRDGRRIEFRQLVPGSPDPGGVFHPLTGIARLVLTVAGTPHDIPVRFTIPYGAQGVPDIAFAFKVFDQLAERALKEAQEKLEQRFREKKIAEAAQIVIPGLNGPVSRRVSSP